MSTLRHRNIMRPLEYDFNTDNQQIDVESQEVKPNAKIEQKSNFSKFYEFSCKLLVVMGIGDVIYNFCAHMREYMRPEETIQTFNSMV